MREATGFKKRQEYIINTLVIGKNDAERLDFSMGKLQVQVDRLYRLLDEELENFHKDERFFSSGFAKATLGRLYADDDYDVIKEGFFAIGNFGLNVGYRFNEITVLELRNELQLSSTALEGSEQFLASGANAVTAYDPSTASGDFGALSSLSLSVSPFKSLNLSFKPHFDAAVVKSRNLEYVDIYGAGLSTELKYHGFFSSLDLSAAIGKRPYDDCDDAQIFFRVGYDFFN